MDQVLSLQVLCAKQVPRPPSETLARRHVFGNDLDDVCGTERTERTKIYRNWRGNV